MKIEASVRFVRVSPTKARPFVRLFKGLPVADALKAVTFSRCKAAVFVGKLLKSAIADVENTHKQSADDFHVEQLIVEDGPTMKRYWARSRGMARPVTKRTSHFRIILENDKG